MANKNKNNIENIINKKVKKVRNKIKNNVKKEIREEIEESNLKLKISKKTRRIIVIIISILALILLITTANEADEIDTAYVKNNNNEIVESNTQEQKEQEKVKTEDKDKDTNIQNIGLVPNGRVDAKVIRVVDGDTFVADIQGKEYRVRLIGVDTPESVSPKKEKNTKQGKKTSEYTKENIEGKDVVLEFDVQLYDRYSRLLAYLYVDGISYNEKLLEEGYAKTMKIAPNVKNAEYYKQIENVAKQNKVGLWQNFF